MTYQMPDTHVSRALARLKTHLRCVVAHHLQSQLAILQLRWPEVAFAAQAISSDVETGKAANLAEMERGFTKIWLIMDENN